MKRLFLAAGLLVAMLIPASSALAAPHNPTGEFAPFADCPLSNTEIFLCVKADTSSGFVTTGKKTVPIVKTATLQGGIGFNEAFEFNFVGAEDGNTLTKAPQPVPGGLVGIPAPESWPLLLKNLYNSIINSNGGTGINATMELARPATEVVVDPFKLILHEGVAVHLPVKIKLDNLFLGSNCYIGSSSEPINLELTTGVTSPPPPNKPIEGGVASVAPTNPEATKEIAEGVKLVDNAFAVPGANGCGGLFSFLVDPFVNSVVGVPSPAGTNTAVLEGKSELAQAEAVRASEP